MQSAAAVLRSAGFRVEPFRPSTLEALRKLWVKFFVQCGAMFYGSEIRGREEQLSPIFKEFLGFDADLPALTANELLQAWAELDLLRSRTLEEMGTYPVLLCPVASVPAFRHGERRWDVAGQSVKYMDAWRYSQWFNVLAAPAASALWASRPMASRSVSRLWRVLLRTRQR